MGRTHVGSGTGSPNILWLLGFLFFALGAVIVMLAMDGLERVGLVSDDEHVGFAPAADEEDFAPAPRIART